MMRYILNLLITLFLLSSLVSEAQTDIPIRKKDFKKGRIGFDAAWQHVIDGNLYFKEKGIWYNNAYSEYLKALVYNNSNVELNYKAGVSALFSDNREEAAGFFLKALELNKNVTKDILFLTARALQYSGKYSEAIEKFKNYLDSTGNKSISDSLLISKYLEECYFATIITKDTLRLEISNLGNTINSRTDDYSEIFSADGNTMYFASRREMPNSGKPYSDTKYDENIFTSRRNITNWDQAVFAGTVLNTRFCETPLYLNARGDNLYIYTGYESRGDIKVSKNIKGIWTPPEETSFGINTKGSETSFTFSPSGNEIYYVSDNGKGNIGGKDIYFKKKLSLQKWSKPYNVGPAINTIYDEESVRFSKNGDTLWFSSRGHNSIGGFDIFYSVLNITGEWETAKNIGYPVNTVWDELFYYPSATENNSFYFVSNRSGGIGGLDIYKGRILPPKPRPLLPQPITLPPPPPPPPPPPSPEPDTVFVRDTVTVVKEVIPLQSPVVQQDTVKKLILDLVGKVTDSETGEPVISKIDIIDFNTNFVVASTASSDIDGSYRVALPAKKSYFVDLRATGFLSDMKRIDVPDNWTKDVYNLNIELIKVKVGKKVVLKNILFETGKTVMTPGSSEELEKLVNILNDNHQMKIEISGHTDKTGSESVNFKLSESRAKAVVEYLVTKGIDRARMEYKGFGSLQPIGDNATPEGRKKNRRVEFKILEF